MSIKGQQRHQQTAGHRPAANASSGSGCRRRRAAALRHPAPDETPAARPSPATRGNAIVAAQLRQRLQQAARDRLHPAGRDSRRRCVPGATASSSAWRAMRAAKSRHGLGRKRVAVRATGAILLRRMRVMGGPRARSSLSAMTGADKADGTAFAVGVWILTGLQCRWAPYDRDHGPGQGQLPVSTIKAPGHR